MDVLHFRCRGHAFSVSADRPEDRSAVSTALAPFLTEAVTTDACYELRTTAPGEYALVVDGRSVRVSDDPDEPFDLLLWYVGEQTVAAEKSAFLLHAGAVVAPGGSALLLPGPSGSGKSTTTFGLVRAGFGYLSDEFAVLDPADGRVSAFPRPIALKEGSRRLLPEADALAVRRPDDPRWTVHVPAGGTTSGTTGAEETHPVRWVVFPTYAPGAATELTALTPGETCIELLRSTFRLSDRITEALATTARVAEEARGFRLAVGDLAEAVTVLTDLTHPALTHSKPIP